MYTAYFIFFIIMIISFITGSIILLVEHKQKKDVLKRKHTFMDKDIV